MELKGMSIDQFKEVVEFVQEHHKFAKWNKDEERKIEVEKYPNISEYGLNIKYVDCHYDSRTSDIWSINFRGFNKLNFSSNSFIRKPDNFKFPFNSLFDWVMAYLKEDWKDKRILEELIMKDK